MLVAGVDVGGTNIMVGLVDDDHSVVDRRKRKTSTGARAVIDTIVAMVLDLDDEPEALGVGVPGIVHDGRVIVGERAPERPAPPDRNTPSLHSSANRSPHDHRPRTLPPPARPASVICAWPFPASLNPPNYR